MENVIWYDFECTDKDIINAEILTGYLLTNTGEDYYIESQVDVYRDDSEKVHGISYGRMKTFPEKIKAHRDLYNWVKPYLETHYFVCYSNPNTIYGTISYDRGVLINSLLDTLGIVIDIDKHFTVYNLVVEASKRGLFTPIKAPNKNGKMQVSYSQPNVYKALFNEEYDAHNAKADVLALKRIYYKIAFALQHNTPITSGGQTTLI